MVFCIFNLRRPPRRVCLVYSPRSTAFSLVLFSYYKTPEKRTKWALILHSWNTIYLKIVGLFLSSFLFTTFIFLSLRHVSSSSFCNLKWKYLLHFAFHGIFTSKTSIENVMNVCPYMYVHISRTWKCHFASKFKTRFCLSHLIKGDWLMFSLRQYCLDFQYFQCSLFNTFTANYFLVNQRQKW